MPHFNHTFRREEIKKQTTDYGLDETPPIIVPIMGS